MLHRHIQLITGINMYCYVINLSDTCFQRDSNPGNQNSNMLIILKITTQPLFS